MLKAILKRALPFVALAAPVIAALPTSAADFPKKPIELVCTTKPGSGAALWCNMMAE